MKYVIDLIDDVRAEVPDANGWNLYAMILKAHPENSEQLINAGESPLHNFHLESEERSLTLGIAQSSEVLSLEKLIKHLLILDMDAMMYEIRLDINTTYENIEIIGFGKAEAEKKYFFFIKL